MLNPKIKQYSQSISLVFVIILLQIEANPVEIRLLSVLASGLGELEIGQNVATSVNCSDYLSFVKLKRP